MARLLRLVSLLGVNAVPGVGFFLAGWSSSTALVLYWWENVFGSLLIAIRIAAHRKLTQERSDYPDRITFKAFRDDFLSSTIVFTAGHGIFLAVILFFLSREQGTAILNGRELREGLVGMTGFLLVGFCTDLVGLGARSFAWLKGIANVALGRILVVHVTIIFGGAAYAYFRTPAAFFGVFIALKVVLDLAWWWPRPEKTVPDWIDLRH